MEAVELDLQTLWMGGAGLQEVKPTRQMYSGRPFAFTNLRGKIGQTSLTVWNQIESKQRRTWMKNSSMG
jgi:hypothetical protein